MPNEITVEMIDDLATGAAFLGTGGGGDPYIGALLCREALERYGPVKLISLDDLDDDDVVLTAASIGAPTIVIEKLFSLEEVDTSIRVLERRLGRQATAIIPCEVGGINSALPIGYAAMRGLPLVDADGMGRAFPTMPMTTFNVAGIAAGPVVLADEFGNSVTIDADGALKSEEIARSIVVGLGASAAITCYPMTGAQAKQASVPGSMTAAFEIGAAIHNRSTKNTPIENLLQTLRDAPLYGEAYPLFEGKISGVERDTTRGWVIGTCEIRAPGGERACRVQFQNENLLVEVESKVQAIVPDLITIVDSETAQPIPTESLRYGQRVTVVGCRAPAQLRSERALEVMGPSKFGLSHPYRPLSGSFEKQLSRE